MWPQIAGLVWPTSYGLALVMALACAWWWSRRRAVARGIHGSHMDLLVPLAFLAGVIGARFLADLLPDGTTMAAPGLDSPFRLQIFGLFALAAPVAVLYAHWARLPTATLLDVLAPPALLWVVIARLGCFAAGCCWGDLVTGPGPLRSELEVGSGWLSQIHTLGWLDGIGAALAVAFPEQSLAWQQHVALGVLEVESPASLPVHPVQLYESFLTLLALGWLLRMEAGRPTRGLVAAAGLVGYATLRFGVEFLRADNALVLGSLSLNQLICVGLVVLGIAWVWASRDRVGLGRPS
jgi:phosphatidylglycerol:prolipoprotein diacylglycerol transferase